MKRNISRITNERGAAGPKAIIAILILAAVIFAGVQLVPLFLDHWNLEDDLKTQVQFLFVNVREKRKEHLTKWVAGELKEMGAKYDAKSGIKVEVDNGKKKVKVEVWYTRSHKLPIYPNPKQFYIKRENTPLEGL